MGITKHSSKICDRSPGMKRRRSSTVKSKKYENKHCFLVKYTVHFIFIFIIISVAT